MSRQVEAVRTILVRAPADVVVAVVNDIASIHRTERKADTCEFLPETDTTGTYRITGHVARIVPWRATFRYQLSPHGFHSESTAPVGRGWEVSGGFAVEPLDAQTSRIVHYERYVLPPAVRWIKPMLFLYVHASMRPELCDLARRAEGCGPRGPEPFRHPIFWWGRGLRRRGSVPTPTRAA
jgi:polyketide cyclase/dehydrase/lipid transport protein